MNVQNTESSTPCQSLSPLFLNTNFENLKLFSNPQKRSPKRGIQHHEFNPSWQDGWGDTYNLVHFGEGMYTFYMVPSIYTDVIIPF